MLKKMMKFENTGNQMQRKKMFFQDKSSDQRDCKYANKIYF